MRVRVHTLAHSNTHPESRTPAFLQASLTVLPIMRCEKFVHAAARVRAA
jgi:hypothetical protein